MHPQKIGRARYAVLKMKESEEFVFNSEKLLDYCLADVFSREPRQKQVKVECESRDSGDDELVLCANNSISSTQMKEDFFLVKSKVRLESIFFNEEEAQSQEVKAVAIAMIVCSMLMIALLAVTLDYSQRGLTEVKELFFADGACSDNMQLLEFLYNKGMNLKEYAGQPQFESILASARYETFYVYGLLAAEMLHISTMRTKFTRAPYYLYQFEFSSWRLDSGKAIEVSTTEFMTRLIYAQLVVMSYAGEEGREEEVLRMLETVKANFPQMKENNHKFLQFYLHLFRENKRKVEVLVWAKFAAHFLCTGFLFYSLHSYYRNKQVKAKEIYHMFSLITRKNATHLSQYYLETHTHFKACIEASRQEERQESIMLAKEKVEEPKDEYIWELDLRGKFVADSEKKPAEEFKFLDEKTTNLHCLFLGLFLLLNLINAYLIIRNSDIFEASERMMVNINELMDS